MNNNYQKGESAGRLQAITDLKLMIKEDNQFKGKTGEEKFELLLKVLEKARKQALEEYEAWRTED